VKDQGQVGLLGPFVGHISENASGGLSRKWGEWLTIVRFGFLLLKSSEKLGERKMLRKRSGAGFLMRTMDGVTSTTSKKGPMDKEPA